MKTFHYQHNRQILNLVNLGGSRLAVTVLSLLSSILIARNLGADQLGIFALITGSFAYISIISEFGLRSTITVESSRRHDVGSVFGTYLILRIMMAAVAYVLTMTAVQLLYPAYLEPIAAVMLSIFFLAMQVDWILLVNKNYAAAGWVSLTRWLAYLCLTTIVVHFSKLDINSLAYVFLFSWVILTFFSWLAVVRTSGAPWSRAKMLPPKMPALMKTGGPILGATLASQALQNADLLWIGKTFGPTDAGYYYMANSIITATLFFANAMGQIAMTRYASFNNETTLIATSLKSDIWIMTQISTFISLCLPLIAPVLIPLLFGNEYSIAGTLIISFAPYVILYHLWSLLFSVSIALGMEKVLFKSKILTLCALPVLLAVANFTNTLWSFAVIKGLTLFPAIIFIYRNLERSVQAEIKIALIFPTMIALLSTSLCAFLT